MDKLNLDMPKRYWPEAAQLALEHVTQNKVPTGSDNADTLVGKFKYKIWATKTAINMRLCDTQERLTLPPQG